MKKIDLSENIMKKSTLKKLIETIIRETDDVLTVEENDEEDICGLCGEPGANKIHHPHYWPGEQRSTEEKVHTECEREECRRAHADFLHKYGPEGVAQFLQGIRGLKENKESDISKQMKKSTLQRLIEEVIRENTGQPSAYGLFKYFYKHRVEDLTSRDYPELRKYVRSAGGLKKFWQLIVSDKTNQRTASQLPKVFRFLDDHLKINFREGDLEIVFKKEIKVPGEPFYPNYGKPGFIINHTGFTCLNVDRMFHHYFSSIPSNLSRPLWKSSGPEHEIENLYLFWYWAQTREPRIKITKSSSKLPPLKNVYDPPPDIGLNENYMKKSTLKKLIESVIKETDDYKHLYGPFANSDDDDDYDWPEDDTDTPNTMDVVHHYVFLADTNDKIVKRYDNTIPNKLIKKLRFKGQRVFDGATATWGPIHVDALENNDGEVYAYLLYTNDEDAARAITVGKVHPTEIIGDIIDENVGYAHGNIGGPPEATTHDPLDKTDIVNEYGDPKTRKQAVRSQGQDKALEMIYQWVKTEKIDHSEFVDLINIFIYSDHDPDDEPKQPSSGLRGEP
jgi:hypothetical protein